MLPNIVDEQADLALGWLQIRNVGLFLMRWFVYGIQIRTLYLVTGVLYVAHAFIDIFQCTAKTFINIK